MSQLANLQRQFQNYLMQRSQDIFDQIISTHKVPKDIRLGIYGNAYRSRLHEALASNYPILQKYLGTDTFIKLADEYLDAYPSQFRSIRWFGDELSSFLLKNSEYKEYPYLAELAQFEWSSGLVFDAQDSPVLQVEHMATIPAEAWPDMRLQLHPATQCLIFHWNVVAIWQALADETSTIYLPEWNSVPVTWLVWRQALTIQFSSLAADEAWAIQALKNGFTFSEVCAGLCQWVEESAAGQRAASLLKGWISAGLITGVSH